MADNPPGRSLAAGALSGRDVVVMALASSGPTQSVAVSLAAILATVAYAGFLPILICFIPMLGIAIGYQRLNAWHTSAGATYSWVGRALNPHAGFFGGWIMLMYFLPFLSVCVSRKNVLATSEPSTLINRKLHKVFRGKCGSYDCFAFQCAE